MEASATFEEAWLPGHDGVKFYTRTYAASSPRAVIVFVHGFSEHIGRYEWAHSLFASSGVTVFAYDQRGYGRTALDRAHRSPQSSFGRTSLHDGLLDLEWWLKHLRQQYSGLPVFALGNSMVSSVYKPGRCRVSYFCRAAPLYYRLLPGLPDLLPTTLHLYFLA